MQWLIMINDDITITNSPISEKHQRLYSYHHLCTDTQLYTPKISNVITHLAGGGGGGREGGDLHPTLQMDKLYMTAHKLKT